jgi:hypothetical protein
MITIISEIWDGQNTEAPAKKYELFRETGNSKTLSQQSQKGFHQKEFRKMPSKLRYHYSLLHHDNESLTSDAKSPKHVPSAMPQKWITSSLRS